MATTHRVKQGETVLLLALAYDQLPETIWSANADLAAKRKDQNVLLPGDELEIPDSSDKAESGATEQHHKFVLDPIPAIYRLQMFRQEEPFANQKYELEVTVDGQKVMVSKPDAKTSAKGVVFEAIPAGATSGKLTFPDDGTELEILFGHLDPHDAESGWRQRLAQLGYPCGDPDGSEIDLATEIALVKFQQRFKDEYGLEVTGEPDKKTIDALESLFAEVNEFPEVKNNDQKIGPSPPAKPSAAPAPSPVEEPIYDVVEVVEVIKRGANVGTVAGPCKEGSGKLPKLVDRTEKDGPAYKQFINLRQNIDGPESRHPENGRDIELRARIEWVSGNKKRPLAGKKIRWELGRKPDDSGTRPELSGDDREGLAEGEGAGATYGVLTSTSTTDEEGWAKMVVALSAYAGDQFGVIVTLDPADPDAKKGTKLKVGPWAVWRKFWYQLTRPAKVDVPVPDKSIKAFRDVFAEMVRDDVNELVYDEATAPSGTFYPRWMTAENEMDPSKVPLIGSHNQHWFFDKIKREPTSSDPKNPARPVKGHVVICHGQWDHNHRDASGAMVDNVSELALSKFDIPKAKKTRKKLVTLSLGSERGFILKPALSGTLVRFGRWEISLEMQAKYAAAEKAGTPDPSLPPKPPAMSGSLSDADVEVAVDPDDGSRINTNTVQVTLPAECPDPSKYEIQVLLQTAYGQQFGGCSLGENMLVTYDPEKPDIFAYTMTHEIGHGLNQVPAAHAHHYVGQGGVGPHCNFGAQPSTKVPGELADGACVMFHRQSETALDFCDECKRHLRLEPFLGLKD
jgi:hypothetical protein